MSWLLIAVSVGWVAFAYAGYPLAHWLLARLAPRPALRTRGEILEFTDVGAEPDPDALPALVALLCYTHWLSPRAGRIGFSLWARKVARFTPPFALLVLLAATAAAASQGAMARAPLAIELGGPAIGAALGYAPFRRLALPRLAGFFVLVNASILVAWAHHLAGRRAVTWTPTAL